MRVTLPVLIAALVLSAPKNLVAEKPAVVSDAQLIQLRIPELAAVIDLLGQARVDDAVAKLEELSGRKFKTAQDDPFGADERAGWVNMFQRLAKRKPAFKHAEVVGIQSISSRAKKITFIAIGRTGPMIFHFRLFEYDEKFSLGNIGFHDNWERIELSVATIKNRVSKEYRFMTAIAKKSSKTAKKKPARTAKKSSRTKKR